MTTDERSSLLATTAIHHFHLNRVASPTASTSPLPPPFRLLHHLHHTKRNHPTTPTFTATIHQRRIDNLHHQHNHHTWDVTHDPNAPLPRHGLTPPSAPAGPNTCHCHDADAPPLRLHSDQSDTINAAHHCTTCRPSVLLAADLQSTANATDHCPPLPAAREHNDHSHDQPDNNRIVAWTHR